MNVLREVFLYRLFNSYVSLVQFPPAKMSSLSDTAASFRYIVQAHLIEISRFQMSHWPSSSVKGGQTS